jgi:pimeloyl-ACP methyl ester carboxylesterase
MARTILMIHGYGCAGDCWGGVAARLRAEGYRVETPTLRAELRRVDAPGAGLAGLSLADYVADMSALAASLARETGAAPIVFGHSMGGMIAQKLAEAGLTAGIVLFAPASPADARAKPKLSPVFTFLNIALSLRPETRAVKMWKTGFKWGVLNAVPGGRHDALYAAAVYDSGRALSDLAWPDKDPNRTVHVDAARVKVPVMVAAGALDRTTPVEDVRLVSQKYGADYSEYPANAHWLIDEPGTAVILDDVIGWLNAKGLAATPVARAEPRPRAVKPPAPAPTPVEVAPRPAPAKPKAVAVEATVAAKPRAQAKTKVAPAKAATQAAPPSKPAKAPNPKAETTKVEKTVSAPAATPKAVKPKAPARAKAAPATPAKPAATKAPAKSSPKPKKSV